MSTPYLPFGRPLPLGARAVPIMLALVAGLPAPAGAQGTTEQRQACTGDALKLCFSSIPNVEKTTACMKAHYAELTPRCRAAFATASPPPAAKEPAKEKVAKVPADKPVLEKPREEKPAGEKPAAQRPAAERTAAGKPAVEKPAKAKVARARPVEPVERRARVARLTEPRARRPAETFVPAPRAPSPRARIETPREEAPAVVALPQREPVVPRLSRPRSNLALLCREGLIDAYTCGNTIPALGLGE